MTTCHTSQCLKFCLRGINSPTVPKLSTWLVETLGTLELTVFGEDDQNETNNYPVVTLEETEQDILEGGQERPSEKVVNTNVDLKEQEGARPRGCRWGRAPRKRRQQMGVCLGNCKKTSILQHLQKGRSVSIYGAPSIYKDTAPIALIAPPLPPFLRELGLLPSSQHLAVTIGTTSIYRWRTTLWPQLIGLEVNTSPRLDQSES